MKARWIAAGLLLVAPEARADRAPPPPRVPTIVVDTNELYPPAAVPAPSPRPWWTRWLRFLRRIAHEP